MPRDSTAPSDSLEPYQQSLVKWTGDGQEAAARLAMAEDIAIRQWGNGEMPVPASGGLAKHMECPFLHMHDEGMVGYRDRDMHYFVLAQLLARVLDTPEFEPILQKAPLPETVVRFLIDLAGGHKRVWEAAQTCLQRRDALGANAWDDAGSNLYMIRVHAIRWSTLRGAKLEGRDLSGVSFAGCDLSGADLRGANLDYSDFSAAVLEGADLTGASVRSASFRNSSGRTVGEPADTALSDFPGLVIVAGMRPALGGENRGLPYGRALAATWSPDGSQLTIGGENGWKTEYQSSLAPLVSRSSSNCATNAIPASLSAERLTKFSKGHQGRITAAAISPDGTEAVTGCRYGSVTLWSNRTGKKVRVLRQGTGGGQLDSSVQSLAYHPRNGILAIAAAGEVDLVDPRTAASVKRLTGLYAGFRPAGCLYTRDGSRLITGVDGCIRAWNRSTGTPQQILPLEATFSGGLEDSPDGSQIACTSFQGLKILDAPSGESRAAWSTTGHADSVSYSPDGSLLATASHVVQIWNLKTRQMVRQEPGVSASFSSNGLLAIGTQPGQVTVGNARDGAAAALWNFDCNAQSPRLAFSPDGTRLAAGCLDFKVRILDTGNGACLQTLCLPRERNYIQQWGHGMVLAFSNDGKLLVTGSDSCAVLLWDLGHGGKLLSKLEGHLAVVNGVDFSADGRHIASSSEDGTVRIWDAGSGQQLCVLYTTEGLAVIEDEYRRVIAFAGDGKAAEVRWRYGWSDYEYEAWSHLRDDAAIARRLG